MNRHRNVLLDVRETEDGQRKESKGENIDGRRSEDCA